MVAAKWLKMHLGSFHIDAIEAVLDFTACIRPNGSVYGTSGKCRKGTETTVEPKTFSVGITWGKFNIPTTGHAKVVKELLEDSDRVVVVLSPAAKNVDPNLRKLMFRRLLKKEGVDVNRVQFEHGDSRKVLESLIAKEGAEKVVLGLGQDRANVLQGAMKKLGIGGRVVDRPEGSESSTMMRGIIDRKDDAALSRLYHGDSYLMRLAREARKDEMSR